MGLGNRRSAMMSGKSGNKHVAHHQRDRNHDHVEGLKQQVTDQLERPDDAMEPPAGTDEKHHNQVIFLGVTLGTLFLLSILYDPTAVTRG